MRCTLATILLALLIALAPAPARAEKHAITVGANGDYAQLVDALAATPAGGTIELLPGLQQGHWTITRSVTLRGRHGAVLDGGGTGTLLTITAPDVTLTGLTIQNSGRPLLDDAAIIITADDVRIEGNRFHDIHHAIYVKGGATRAVIRNNTIVGRGELPPEDRGNAIHLWDAPEALVELNTVLHVRDGIYVGFAPRSVFKDNAFRRARYGIHSRYADDNLLEHNIFEETEAGAVLRFSTNFTLRRNVFARSRSSGASGLLLQECAKVLAENNLLVDNSRALFVSGTDESVFRHNRFATNDLAVQMDAGAERNRFEGNDFVANVQLVLMGTAGSNVWDGNYWEEYLGLDMDRDGYGDAPFATGAPLTPLPSNHLQLRLFNFSPAVQAPVAVDRRFPVLDLPEVRDPQPAMSPVALAGGKVPVLSSPPRGPRPALATLALAMLLAAAVLLLPALSAARGRSEGRSPSENISFPSPSLRVGMGGRGSSGRRLPSPLDTPEATND